MITSCLFHINLFQYSQELMKDQLKATLVCCSWDGNCNVQRLPRSPAPWSIASVHWIQLLGIHLTLIPYSFRISCFVLSHIPLYAKSSRITFLGAHGRWTHSHQELSTLHRNFLGLLHQAYLIVFLMLYKMVASIQCRPTLHVNCLYLDGILDLDRGSKC